MGWSENDVENLLRHLSDMDSNNFPGKHGGGVLGLPANQHLEGEEKKVYKHFISYRKNY